MRDDESVIIAQVCMFTSQLELSGEVYNLSLRKENAVRF